MGITRDEVQRIKEDYNRAEERREAHPEDTRAIESERTAQKRYEEARDAYLKD